MDAMIGRTLGKYQIVEQLGEGGMATVYKAFDPSLERYVAIKVIRSGNQVDPLFLTRFQREAKALAKLDHPYILKVLDYGEENGIPYLVMPFVPHGTLKQYVLSKMSSEKAISIVLPIAEALSYAHKRNIIHRDIKPANILFSESGAPVLSDFGIAKILDSGDQTQLTGTGVGIGTPAYMAPEQWNGVADERTDIYSLGIVLYELLTGRCPFQADTPVAILLKQVQDPLQRPKTFAPDIPDGVEEILFKALAKDPNLRYQSMQDFIDAMKDALRSESVSTIDSPHRQLVENSVTQAIPRPPVVTSVPIQFSNQPKRKQSWLPLIIIGSLVFVGVWVFIIVKIGQSKTKNLNMELMNATAEITSQNLTTNDNRDNSQNPDQSTRIAQSTSVGGFPELQTTSESVTTIDQLPTDIPVFSPNNGDVTTTAMDGALMVYYSTGENQKIVKDYFLQMMASNLWKLESTSEMAAQNTTFYTFSKENRMVMIYVMPVSDTQTYIEVTIPDTAVSSQ